MGCTLRASQSELRRLSSADLLHLALPPPLSASTGEFQRLAEKIGGALGEARLVLLRLQLFDTRGGRWLADGSLKRSTCLDLCPKVSVAPVIDK